MDSSLGHPTICKPSIFSPYPLQLHQVGPNGFMHYVFKHNNWDQFVRSVDNELELKHHNRHGEVPPFGLVWLGTHVDEQVSGLVFDSGSNSMLDVCVQLNH